MTPVVIEPTVRTDWPKSVTAGSGPGLVVTAEDPDDNVDSESSGGNVTVARAADLAAPTWAGRLP